MHSIYNSHIIFCRFFHELPDVSFGISADPFIDGIHSRNSCRADRDVFGVVCLGKDITAVSIRDYAI